MHKILLVEDHEIVKDAISSYFEHSDIFVLAAYARNGREALEVMKTASFDLVITDLHMPEMNGTELVEQIGKLFPEQKILVLTMYDDLHTVRHMLQLGISGYLLKNSPKAEFMKALQCIMNNQTYYAKAIYDVIMSGVKHTSKRQSETMDTTLSKREKEILVMVAKEMSNHEIAEKLYISARTVETHKRNLLKKTGCKNAAGLALFAFENFYL